MPLPALATIFWDYFPLNYVVHISLGIVITMILRTYAQGRVTSRERDLHGRVILLTVRHTWLSRT